jgi:hypothetical protein
MDVEINPIAIPLKHYNQQIANLVEHLLKLDQELFEADKTPNPRGDA